MIFNGIEKPYLTVTRGRKRPAWAPVQRNFITVTGMPGAYVSSSQTQIRQIDVPVLIQADSFVDLQKVKEDLAEWLIHDEAKELIFKDEPDRTYYAQVEGSLNLAELVRWGDGTITFICADPYKYGPEQTRVLEDISVVDNKGTAEADPIFELTAKKKATFAMISNGDDEYNLIGRPADVDEQVVDEKTTLFTERGNTLDAWDIPQDDSVGSLTTTGDAIVINSWGTGNSWHGPALMREVNPLDDYEVEMYVYLRTENPNQTFRVTTNLFDENMDEISMLRLWDKTTNQIRKVAEGRLGEYISNYVNYLISDRNYNLQGQRVWGGILRIRKEGNKFTFYVARVTQGGRHTAALTETFIDKDNEYTGRLKFIRFDMATYGDTGTPNEIRIEYIKVSKLSEVTIDQTPYIVDVGDVVTFDHKDDDILINGEPRNDLKNFGGSFFKLEKGFNNLVVSPEDSFNTKVKYRERYR